MKLSIAITSYNRYEMTVESFAQVIDDPRIDDIVLLDDASTDGSFEKLRDHFKGNEKVRVIRQAQNRGMSKNKHDAIALAKNRWVIIFDSDNIIGPDYLDAFAKYTGYFEGEPFEYAHNHIFCPDFAKPQFNYREYNMGGGGSNHIYRSGIYAKAESKIEIKHDDFNCLMNTANYIVNRDFYLKVYQFNSDHIASDTIWHNYNHLKSGGMFSVVPGMEYYHRVHNGSGFLQDADYNMKKSAEVRRLIMQL